MTDKAGNKSPEGSDTSTVGDTTAPTAPSVVINDGGDGVINPTDLVNGKVTATVKPTEPVEEGDKVTITLPNGSTQEVVVDGSNKDDINTNGIVVEFDKPADGTDVELTATVTDKAGNKSPEGSDSSTVDLVVPGDVDGDGEKDPAGAPVVVIQDGGDDVINPSDLNDDGTVDAIVTFPEDAGYSVGDTVVIKDQDGTELVNRPLTEADLENGITVQVPVAEEGEETVVTVVVTDPEGNTSPEGSDSSTVDLAPEVNNAPDISITLTDAVRSEEAVVDTVVATYTTYDKDGDQVTVTFTEGTNDLGYFEIINGKVVLTEAGAKFVNQGGTLPEINLTANDGQASSSDQAIPLVKGAVATLVEVEKGETTTETVTKVAENGGVNKNLPGLSNVEYSDDQEAYTSTNQNTKIWDYYALYLEAMNKVRANAPEGTPDSQLVNEFNNAINSLQLSNNSGSSSQNDIYVVDLPNIIKLIKDYGLQDNFIPTRMNGTRNEASDWVIFKMPYDSEFFKIQLVQLNPARDNLNRFDGFSFKVLVNGVWYDYILNNVQGVIFENGAVLSYDENGKVTIDESNVPLVTTVEYTSYNIDLTSKLLGSSISTEKLYGLKFNLNGLINNDAKVNFEIYYNGEKIIADVDGWYVLTNDDSSTIKSFEIVVKVPHDQFAIDVDADSFKKQLEDYLSEGGSVLPVQELSVVVNSIVLPFIEMESEVDIFSILNQEYALENGEANQVDGFTIGSNDQIDISSLLSADATASNLAEFVTVDYDAENDQAVISIDRDGSMDQYHSEKLVILLNQPNAFDLDDLVQNNQIIIG